MFQSGNNLQKIFILIGLFFTVVPASMASSDVDHSKDKMMAPNNSVLSEYPNTQWSTQSGESLQSTVYQWSRRAGYEVVWDAPYDFPVMASIVLSGSYESALAKLFNAYAASERPLKVDVFRSQKVVHVEPY